MRSADDILKGLGVTAGVVEYILRYVVLVLAQILLKLVLHDADIALRGADVDGVLEIGYVNASHSAVRHSDLFAIRQDL